MHDTPLKEVCCVPVEGLRECELIDALMYWVAPPWYRDKAKSERWDSSEYFERLSALGVLSCSFFLILGRVRKSHVFIKEEAGPTRS